MISKGRGAAARHSKPADRKQDKLTNKRGIASHQRGIRYGSREAGRATEHCEWHDHEPHTHGSRKMKKQGTEPRRKTHERRITSG